MYADRKLYFPIKYISNKLFSCEDLRFDLKNIKLSKLKSPSFVLSGDKILPPKENILSTAALAGRSVLYFKKKLLDYWVGI